MESLNPETLNPKHTLCSKTPFPKTRTSEYTMNLKLQLKSLAP